LKIIENGINSFEKAVELLMNIDFNNDEQDEFTMKEVILNLHHSIEVLFKYILKQENEYSIYSDKQQLYNSLIECEFRNKTVDLSSYNTITFMDAVNRVLLDYIKNKKVSEYQYECFNKLNEWRNKLTHFEFDFEAEEINHKITAILPLLYEIFMDKLPKFDEIMLSFYFLYKDIYAKIIDNAKSIDSDIYVEEKYFNFYKLCCILNKFSQASARIEFLNNHPEKIKEIYEKITENNKCFTKIRMDIHHKCPFCNKKAFVRQGCLFRDYGEMIYYGECEYCNIKISKYEAVIIENVLAYFLEEDDNISKDINIPNGYIYDSMYGDVAWLLEENNLASKFGVSALDDIRQAYNENRRVFDSAILDNIKENVEGYIDRILLNDENLEEIIIRDFFNKGDEYININDEIKYARKSSKIENNCMCIYGNIIIQNYNTSLLDKFKLYYNNLSLITNNDLSSINKDMKFIFNICSNEKFEGKNYEFILNFDFNFDIINYNN